MSSVLEIAKSTFDINDICKLFTAVGEISLQEKNSHLAVQIYLIITSFINPYVQMISYMNTADVLERERIVI